MNRTVDVGREVEELLHARGYAGVIDRATPLGAGGVGLDSIAIVEVLLACEERFGLVIAAELLEGERLTVGLLVDRIEEMLAS
jgi:acyl carrier protein